MSNLYLVKGRIEQSYLFIDQFDIHSRIISLVLDFLYLSSPTHYKLLFKNLVITWHIRMTISNKINHPIEGELNIIFCVAF